MEKTASMTCDICYNERPDDLMVKLVSKENDYYIPICKCNINICIRCALVLQKDNDKKCPTCRKSYLRYEFCDLVKSDEEIAKLRREHRLGFTHLPISQEETERLREEGRRHLIQVERQREEMRMRQIEQRDTQRRVEEAQRRADEREYPTYETALTNGITTRIHRVHSNLEGEYDRKFNVKIGEVVMIKKCAYYQDDGKTTAWGKVDKIRENSITIKLFVYQRRHFSHNGRTYIYFNPESPRIEKSIVIKNKDNIVKVSNPDFKYFKLY